MAKEFSYGICPYKIVKDTVHIVLIQPKGHTEWGFMKGKIEQNESIEECAVREAFEETGLKIDIEHLEDYFTQKNRRKDIGIFLVNVDNIDLKKIKLQKGEVNRIKYFDIKYNVSINKNQQEILNFIKAKFLKFL